MNTSKTLILVIRKDKSVRIVRIIHDEATDKYAFVNLTSNHICKCRFNSYEESLEDLQSNKNVESFKFLN